MEQGHTIPSRLAAGEVLVGAFLDVTDPLFVEAVCGTGPDYVILEFEHGLRDYSTIGVSIRAAEACGVPAIVRIGERSHNLAERVLDAGAAGIMFPHVTTKADAEEIVSWCRYSPMGVRGSGVTRASLRHVGSEYERRQQASRDVAIFAVVEDLEGVANVENILSVDGLTGIVCGPGDLAMALGAPEWNDPRVLDMLDEIQRSAARFADKATMRLCWEPSQAEQLIANGVNVLLINHDVHLVRALYTDLLNDLRGRVTGALANR